MANIPLDTYIAIAPETDYIAKGHINLGGTDIFIYISTTNELRSVALGETTFNSLVEGVLWVTVWQPDPSHAHIYYIDQAARVWHVEYDQYGPLINIPVMIAGVPLCVTIDVIDAPHTTPPVWVMMLDDGAKHHIFTAATPDFGTILQSMIVYNNLLDHTYYNTLPTIALHPSDTVNLTVAMQQQSLSNSTLFDVGFYVIPIPGVT